MPLGDLGIRKGCLHLYDMKPSKSMKDDIEKVKELTQHWEPYRSIGACYLWKVADMIKMERKKANKIE